MFLESKTPFFPVHRNRVKSVYVKRVIEILEEYGKS